MSETPHEIDLIKTAESLMRVIPDEARLEIMRQYCYGCGRDDPDYDPSCWCQHDD